MQLIKQIINELNVRHVTSKQDPAQTNIDPKNITKSKSNQLLGSGKEAVVFHNTNKSHQAGVITKWVRDQLEPADQNGTIQYLIKGAKLGNYMIPIVYEIKQISKSDGKFDFYIKMEKLHKTLYQIDLDRLQLDALASQVFENIPSGQITTAQRLAEYIHESWWYPSVQIQGAHYSLTDQCRQIMDLIKNVTQQEQLGDIDIHDENIMIRLTSVGMQLVFTDPIYCGEYD